MGEFSKIKSTLSISMENQMKIALVTGANRGIGLEVSKQLARKEFKVYMGMRNPDDNQKLIEELLSEGLNIKAVKLDVTKTADVRAVQTLIKESEKHIDVLVNNAGVFLETLGGGLESSVLNVDPVIVLKTIETNTIGPLKLIQAFAPLMLSKGSGRIINVSSGMGSLSEMEGKYPGYRMSKTALNALTEITQAEVTGSEIYINSVCPGWVRTDMGGESAHRSVAEGAETIVWLATTNNPPQGKFLRDKQIIDW